MEEQYNQLNTLQIKFNTLQTQYQLQETNLTKQINTLTTQIANDKHHQELLTQAQTIFKQLQDSLTHKQIEHITTLCNDALKSVFNDDQFNYHLEIETSLTNQRPQAKFILTTTNLYTKETTQTLLQNNGFGIQSLIGFILQVYYVINTNQEHLLFLDESLTAISKDHLPKLKEFIKQISDKFKFTFVLIVHDKELLELADHTFIVNDGQIQEVTNE